MTRLTYRSLCFAGFAGCVAGLLFALLLQHGYGLEPCPMCIFQRVAMAFAGLGFLGGAVFAPKAGGRWLWVVLALLGALAGAAIAGRHVWLQGLPPDQVPACGPTLDYLLDLLPVGEVVTLVLKGDGNCAKIDAAFLGISLPGWTLVAFIALSLYALLIPRLARRHSIFS
ncbi:MAG: disulfide bond formation protein B [Nevskia sp.]|uniref:disulfide bond formation protein B n=1 Tax=Nevskia sp. TaxID=1929292 RepID=UPI0040372C7A